MAAISTPCNKVCKIDAASRLCIGCGRSIDEIGHWLSLSEGDRRRIMDALPARLRRVAALRAATTPP